MEALAETLGFEFTDIDISSIEDDIPRTEDGSIDAEKVDIDKVRRYLEDTISLVDLAEDASVDDAIDVYSDSIDDDDDDDDAYQ